MTRSTGRLRDGRRIARVARERGPVVGMATLADAAGATHRANGPSVKGLPAKSLAPRAMMDAAPRAFIVGVSGDQGVSEALPLRGSADSAKAPPLPPRPAVLSGPRRRDRPDMASLSAALHGDRSHARPDGRNDLTQR
jgi:hypothetical protein